MRQPIETFATLAFFRAVALTAHVIYRGFSTPQPSKKSSLIRNALEKLGLYLKPSAGTLWIMGMIGLLGLIFGFGGRAKVAQGLMFLAWAPFLIPMYVMQEGSSYCSVKKNYFSLFFFMGIIVVIGIAFNARGMMLAGFMTIALFALLTAMRSTKPVVASQVIKLGMVGILLGTLSIPFADLATASVMARKFRSQASAMKMIENTLYNFQHPELIKAYLNEGELEGLRSNYEETYLRNPLMARVVETKFHDNMFYFSEKLTPKAKDDLMKVSFDFLWTILPEPILKLLKVDLEKSSMLFLSLIHIYTFAHVDNAAVCRCWRHHAHSACIANGYESAYRTSLLVRCGWATFRWISVDNEWHISIERNRGCCID